MAAILVEAPIAEGADVEVTRPGIMNEQLARIAWPQRRDIQAMLAADP